MTHQRAIPTRIVAVLGAVGIAAAVLASGCAYDRLAAADQADQAAAAIEAAALASSVANEIQRERGLAASVAATGADWAQQATVAQRARTDEGVAALTSLKDFGADIGPEAAEALESAMNDLSDLSLVRRDVDSGGLGVPATIDRYTRMVAGLDTFMDGSISGPVAMTEAWNRLEALEESAGLERALGALALAGEGTPALVRSRISDLQIEQSQHLDEVRAVLPNDLLAAFDADLGVADEAYRRQVEYPAFPTPASTLEPAGWFEVATLRMQPMQQTVQAIALRLRDHWQSAATTASSQGQVLLSVAVTGVVLAILAGALGREWVRKQAFPILAVAGVLGSIIGSAYLHATLDSERRSLQVARHHEAVSLVDAALARYVSTTQALAVAVAAEPDLTESEFQAYASEILDPSIRSGVSDLNLLALVEPEQVAAFESSMRARGNEDFAITPRPTQTAAVITYRYASGEPRLSTAGLDARTIETARQSIDAAATTATAAATAVFPVADDRNGPGAVVIYVPVRRDGELIGFVNAVLFGRPFLEGIEGLPDDIAVSIIDRAEPRASFFARTDGSVDLGETASVVSIERLGRHWEIVLDTLPSALPSAAWLPAMAAILGIVVTVGVAIALLYHRRGRERAEQLAKSRTAELERATEELRAINLVGRTISSTFDVRMVLEMVVERGRDLVEADACALFLVDHERRVIVRGHGVGIDPQELADHTYQELDAGLSGVMWRNGSAVVSNDIARDARNVGQAAARALHRDGVSIAVVPIMGDGAVVGSLSALSRDARRPMTNREAESLELLARQAAVAIRNANLYSQLAETNAELHAAQVLQDEFVANISHEFRTPLTVIGAATEMLAEDGLDAESVGELVRRIASNSTRLEMMVEDILLASSIESGKAKPRPQAIELRQRITDVIRDLGTYAEGVACEVPAGLHVLVDPHHLDRVIVNLLSNAHKYGRPPVTVSMRNLPDHVEIVVSDCGPGIGDGLRQRLFERFEQGDNFSTRRSQGIGLGLHIVDELARINGGTVRYEGSERGAVFVVEVPAAPGFVAVA